MAAVRAAIDHAIDYATTEIEATLARSPSTQLMPVAVIAALAAAAFLGMEVLAQSGREIDLDKLTTSVAAGVHLLTSGVGRKPAFHSHDL